MGNHPIVAETAGLQGRNHLCYELWDRHYHHQFVGVEGRRGSLRYRAFSRSNEDPGAVAGWQPENTGCGHCELDSA